jgi:hypothetical protein
MKCFKPLSTFITRIEERDAVVDGKTIHWTVPNAYCPDCDSMVWLGEFDDIYVTEFEKAVKENRE